MVLCLGTMILCATTLAVLLVVGEVEKSPVPGVEAEKIVQVVCSGCDRNLISKILCNSFELLFLSSVTAEGMLKLKWWRAGNGPVISVDRRDSGC